MLEYLSIGCTELFSRDTVMSDEHVVDIWCRRCRPLGTNNSVNVSYDVRDIIRLRHNLCEWPSSHNVTTTFIYDHCVTDYDDFDSCRVC